MAGGVRDHVVSVPVMVRVRVPSTDAAQAEFLAVRKLKGSRVVLKGDRVSGVVHSVITPSLLRVDDCEESG